MTRSHSPRPSTSSISPTPSQQSTYRRDPESSRTILDSLTAHIALLDSDGAIVQVNSAWERFACANGDPTLARSGVGVNYLAVCRKAAQQGDESALQVEEGLRRLQERSLPEFSFEYPCHSPTEQRWFLLSATPLTGGHGLVCSHTPITTLKRTEYQLRQSEERLRESQAQLQLIADSLPVLIAYIDAGGYYRFNNAAYERWFGLAKAACKGRHMREVLGDAAYDTLKDHVEAALAGQPRSFETRVPYKEAGARDVHVEYVPHRDGSGKVLGFYALIMDISDRRRAEEALRDSERRFRVLADHAPIGIFLTDHEGRTTYTNSRCQQIYGFGMQEALGHGWSDFIHPKDRDCVLERWLQLAPAAQEFSMEYRAIRPDGECRWVQDHATPLFSERGEVTGHVGTVEDITERKQAEEALREREARLSAVLDTAADAIITIDASGRIESVNTATERMFGYRAAEMVGQNVRMLMPSPYREEHDQYLSRYLRTGVRNVIGIGREVQAVRKDGTVFAIDLAVSETVPRRLFTGIVRDISVRKQLEREVLEIAAGEQRRIGQELHDGVGQELTGLSLMLDTLVERLGAPSPKEASLAARALDGLERVHRQVRALSHGLVPVEVDPDGLRIALEELAQRTEDQSGVSCRLECVGPVAVADSIVATHLFRIAQEAVSNALRHGRPRNIWITLRSDSGVLTLGVRDDGMGGTLAPSDQGKGLGIRLMRYRAGAVGGTLAVEPATTGGTVVQCVIPGDTGRNHV